MIWFLEYSSTSSSSRSLLLIFFLPLPKHFRCVPSFSFIFFLLCLLPCFLLHHNSSLLISTHPINLLPQGRKFYSCRMDQDQQCKFFMWAEVIKIPTLSPSLSLSLSLSLFLSLSLCFSLFFLLSLSYTLYLNSILFIQLLL